MGYNIDKIIETYRQRIAIDKYSALASLDLIKENDYNLNIPRYVDTFEEEEAIDLDVVADELVEIDKELLEANKAIAEYCSELGIKIPF
jgi:type I restriction enzyme M protein